MEGIVGEELLDARVLRNPWHQGRETRHIGDVAAGEAVPYYHQDHRQRFPYTHPLAEGEHHEPVVGELANTFELHGIFDVQPSKPWRAGIMPPPKLPYVTDTDHDGKNSLAESQAVFGARGVQYHMSGAMSFGFAPQACPPASRVAANYRYGMYDRQPPQYEPKAHLQSMADGFC